MVSETSTSKAIPLRTRITCPHCWTVFPPESVLWVAEHPDLVGDVRLGSDDQQRFLPTRFTADASAIDSRGFPCHLLACPHCHLIVPRPLLEMDSVFFSILGAPASGKSYFLASMTWRLRQEFPKRFSISLTDADPAMNQRLHSYEELQFLNPDEDKIVQIEKTETQGDHYDTVAFSGQAINYPRPFLFSLTPMASHPNAEIHQRLSRVLCLYDNAGESFLPGEDNASSPVTRHLALSRCLFFLFDPTQDIRFRRAARGKTDDLQKADRAQILQRDHAVRQDTILQEAADRVRRFAGIGHNQKHQMPLIIVATKVDSWRSLLKSDLKDAVTTPAPGKSGLLRTDKVERLSSETRDLFWELCPEIVSTAENFAADVTYIPVSATGCSPDTNPETGVSGFRPRDIKPEWVEVPMLYALHRTQQGLIPIVRP
jgi:hypothetical protein